jgi:nitronate monooxygenase
MWPNQSFLDRIGIELPIIQAPMAGRCGSDMAVATCKAGGLGSLPCAMLSAEQIREEVEAIRSGTDRPFNLNFLCFRKSEPIPDEISAWRQLLKPYFDEAGIDVPSGPVTAGRHPFGEETLALVEEIRPAVISFHFGLPDADLFDRVKALGAVVLCSATTSEEARWLEARGVDAIIAQGAEAGGHRGKFLDGEISAQPGTFALVPQVVDSVSLPVIATGGIGDGRGIAAAFALGASCAQIGTTYLFCNEVFPSPIHHEALKNASDFNTTLTNLFTGLPARGVVNRLMRELGPINPAAPGFPLAASDLAELRSFAESESRNDFTPLWSGQSASLGRCRSGQSATDVTRQLAEEALAVMS